MKVKEIREMTTEDINKKIVDAKQELFNLRFQQATGLLEKPSRIKELRHDVARCKTVLREREITVVVETYKKDPLYGKRVKYSKKYAVHDESNKAKVGDTVRIVETRPLSKTKYFYLKEIIEEAVIL